MSDRQANLAAPAPASDSGVRNGAALQRACACGQPTHGAGECEACRRKRHRLQRRPAGRRDPDEIPPIVEDVLRSPGRPLDAATRAEFEPRFGRDFSAVRIHADARAAASARAVDAHAYTVGRHVVFGAARYAPRSRQGRALLAHELTHVVQQENGRASRNPARSESAFEREAEANARRVDTAAPFRFRHAPARLARQSTTTVQEPTGTNDCRLEQHRAIAPAVQQSLAWLQRTVSALDRFLADPAAAGNDAVRAALQRHFHSADAAVARTLRDRLDLLRDDITRRGDPANPDPQRRQTFTVECHDASDTLCEVANAYVTGGDNTLVLCPIFFDSFSPQQRSMSIVHEMAHALLGLNITDRAYNYDRLLPYLSTAEALDNAESYALFVQELGTGSVPATPAPRDELEDCPPETAQLAREALARGERWNREANTVLRGSAAADLLTTHLGDATPATRTTATRTLNRMEDRLRRPVRLACSGEGCGTRVATKREAVDRSGAGAGIGAAILGVVGAVAGGVLGGVLGGVGGAVAGGFLGGLLGAGLGALIGLAIGSAVSTEAAIQLCPAWARQSAEDDRIESLLAVAYEVYAGLSEADGRRYAALARAIHGRYYPPPSP